MDVSMRRFPPIDPDEWRDLAWLLLDCVVVSFVYWWLP
jgi:hypothetical protein